jgi:hypothetical protein
LPLLTPPGISRDLAFLDNVAIANGMVYALQTGEQTARHISNREGDGPFLNWGPPETIASLSKIRRTQVAPIMLHEPDGWTGKEFDSRGKLLDSWVGFGRAAVALGKVFLMSHDAHNYAFGLKR